MGKRKKNKNSRTDWGGIERAMKYDRQNPNKLNGAITKLVSNILKRKKLVAFIVLFFIYLAIVGLVINTVWLIDGFKLMFM